jgi:hypothetical protein
MAEQTDKPHVMLVEFNTAMTEDEVIESLYSVARFAGVPNSNILWHKCKEIAKLKIEQPSINNILAENPKEEPSSGPFPFKGYTIMSPEQVQEYYRHKDNGLTDEEIYEKMHPSTEPVETQGGDQKEL